MSREALAGQRDQQEGELRIIASEWTAPSWMKNIETWFIPATEDNGWRGDGGRLKPQ